MPNNTGVPVRPAARQRLLLGAVAAIVVPSAGVGQQAHVHGTAQVNVVVEGSQATIEFIAPAEGVYGFERAPRNAAEEREREAGLERVRARIADMVVFDTALGCQFSASQVSDRDESHGHEEASDPTGRAAEHAEVHAEFAVECARALAGSPLRFGVTNVFPGIEEVDVQVLTDRGQDGLKVVRDRGDLRL